jgi:hypothetical protein
MHSCFEEEEEDNKYDDGGCSAVIVEYSYR